MSNNDEIRQGANNLYSYRDDITPVSSIHNMRQFPIPVMEQEICITLYNNT